MSLRLGVDMKLFDAAAKTSINGGEMTIEQLSSETGADPLLVSKYRIVWRSPKKTNDGDRSRYESASRHGHLQANGRRLLRIDTSRRLRFELPLILGCDSYDPFSHSSLQASRLPKKKDGRTLGMHTTAPFNMP